MVATFHSHFNRALIFLALFTISFSGFSQAKKNLEYSGFFDSYYFRGPLFINAWGGLGFYNGDLCGGLGCNKLGPNAGLGISYKMWPRVHFGADVNYIKLGAQDVVAERGFTYSGLNFELMLYGKYFIVEDIIRKHHQMNAKKKPFKPYVLLGFNNLYYIASTSGNGAAGYTPSPALGIGGEIYINEQFRVTPELTYRYLFTDNLDAVAAGSSPDSYLTFGIRVGYTPFAKKKKRRKLKEEEVEAIQKMVDASSDSTGTSSKAATDSTGSSEGTNAVEEDDANDYLNDLLQRPDEEELPDEGENTEDDESDYYEGEDEDTSEDDESEYYEDEEEDTSSDDEDDGGGWDDSGW